MLCFVELKLTIQKIHTKGDVKKKTYKVYLFWENEKKTIQNTNNFNALNIYFQKNTLLIMNSKDRIFFNTREKLPFNIQFEYLN